MIKQHPELADRVDITTASHEELIRVVRELSFEKTMASIAEYTEVIGRANKELEKAKDNYKSYEDFLGPTSAKHGLEETFEEFVKNTPQYAKSSKDLSMAIKTIAGNLADLAFTGKKSMAEVKASIIDTFIITNPELSEFAPQVQKATEAAFEKMKENAARSVKVIKDKLQSLPVEFQEAFRSLDAADFPKFIDMIKKMESDVSEFTNSVRLWNKQQEESGQSLLISEKKIAQAREDIRKQALEDFLSGTKTKIKAEQEMIQRINDLRAEALLNEREQEERSALMKKLQRDAEIKEKSLSKDAYLNSLRKSEEIYRNDMAVIDEKYLQKEDEIREKEIKRVMANLQKAVDAQKNRQKRGQSTRTK